MDRSSVTNSRFIQKKSLLLFALFFMGLSFHCSSQLSINPWNIGSAIPTGRLAETTKPFALGSMEVKVNYMFMRRLRHEVSVVAGFSNFPAQDDQTFNGSEYFFGGEGFGQHIGAEYHYYMHEYDFREYVHNIRPYLIGGFDYSQVDINDVSFYDSDFTLIHEIPEIDKKTLGGVIGMGILLNSSLDIELKYHARPDYSFVSISFGFVRIGKYDYWF